MNVKHENGGAGLKEIKTEGAHGENPEVRGNLYGAEENLSPLDGGDLSTAPLLVSGKGSIEKVSRTHFGSGR